jgi:hypothetical protein
MTAWLKITKPNVEVGANFVLYQSAILDIEEATGFAVQTAGTVAVFINGKAYVIQKQFDEKAYTQVLAYVQKKTGKELP